MDEIYAGPEQRKFLRLNHTRPLNYKICNKETISKLLQGYTANISQSGILCNIKEEVKSDDILWLSFDRETLDICKDIERSTLVYQGGIIGKVVRVEKAQDVSFDVGLQFITREEEKFADFYLKPRF